MTSEGRVRGTTAWPARRAAGDERWYELPLPLVLGIALICVEAFLVAPGHVLAADIADAVLLLVLLQPVLASSRGLTPSKPYRNAMFGLALVPLIRVVSLGLPLRDGSEPAGTLLVAGLLGLVAAQLAPSLGISRRSFVAIRGWAVHSSAALAGLLLGLVAYLVGANSLWSRGTSASRVGVVLIAAALAAVVEELIFRGVVQLTLQRAAGRSGLLLATALFAAFSLHQGNASVVLTIVLAGTVFAHTVARTGALGGALAGHVFLVLGAGGLWPAVFGREHSPVLAEPVSLFVLSGLLAGLTLVLVHRGVTTRDAGEARRGERLIATEEVLRNLGPKFTMAQFAEARAAIHLCSLVGYLNPSQVAWAEQLLAEIEASQRSGKLPHPG